MKVAVYFDGGAWPNPGPAAAGAVVVDENGVIVVERKKDIGEATNNAAEYQGLILAAGLARFCGATEAHFISDSELVVNQINAFYAVNGNLHQIHSLAMGELMRLPYWSISHVPREQNKRADWLCNLVLRPDDKRATKIPDFAVKYKPPAVLQPGWANRPRSKRAQQLDDQGLLP